ncbi:hypothetical protein KPATCC21470_6962 [Kitasatospora purpeofusca]
MNNSSAGGVRRVGAAHEPKAEVGSDLTGADKHGGAVRD